MGLDLVCVQAEQRDRRLWEINQQGAVLQVRGYLRCVAVYAIPQVRNLD